MREIKIIHSSRGGFIRRVIHKHETNYNMTITSSIEDSQLHPYSIPKSRWLICQMSHKNQCGIGCHHGDECEASVDGLLYNERRNKQ
jgi:hypothetical protein